ncbi:RluA family pseudouridine synthase [Sporosarcina soli]|uniref:Pseudouridine synthase n=1 Tax=Sporosarcina soli TaxID=334736 RepID=A0ABW0TIB5_9BACL
MINRDGQDPRFRLTFHVEEDDVLLREFLHAKGISRRTLTATKYEGGHISVNGIERNVRHLLQKGDLVAVHFPPEQPSAGLQPEEGELSILYEDEAFIIVDKPAGKSTIPSRDHPTGTVANLVAGKFAREGLPATVHVVTRLDRDTSGLLCIAKNRHIHHLLSEQMMASGFHREYKAIVEGWPEIDRFVIEQPLGRKEGSIIKRIVRPDGQYARTDVEVLRRLQRNGQSLALVKLVLQTGRTHQIRVHMQWKRHPLSGDDLYGGSTEIIGRQALHCAKLGFTNPLTGIYQLFNSDLPHDMQCMISQTS